MFQLAPALIDNAASSARREDLLLRGFLTFPEFTTSLTLGALEAECTRLAANHDPGLYGIVRDRRGEVLVMNNLDKDSDLLFDAARSPSLMALAEHLIGRPPVPLHVEFFQKPAEESMPTPPHQDQVFYQGHFDDELATSFWIALDPATTSSGAMEFSTFVPDRVLEHRTSPSIDFDYELANDAEAGYVPAPVPQGGCVVHHAYAIHRAPRNATDRRRRAVVFNYRGSEYRAALKRQGRWP